MEEMEVLHVELKLLGQMDDFAIDDDLHALSHKLIKNCSCARIVAVPFYSV